ncbi:hypothetical protein V3470_04930 [Flavobacterium oreochromis]|uniref:Uncharacterized protein n=1 Tax=Flavobacterium oreochromis TaxID=2906078 RepID=A0ABW8P7D3_9FLAO|nr:hypothetical protein [Flavobacterium oreochromis]OWP76131.1 hypothetical protein BWG23_08970 [Flavobacterium oreochromis]
MKKLEEKFNELKNKFDSSEFNEINNDIRLVLINLEKEIKKFREIEIYKEDFSDLSWSYVTKNKKLSFVKVYLNTIEND